MCRQRFPKGSPNFFTNDQKKLISRGGGGRFVTPNCFSVTKIGKFADSMDEFADSMG
jgi:hypothetical protein